MAHLVLVLTLLIWSFSFLAAARLRQDVGLADALGARFLPVLIGAALLLLWRRPLRLPRASWWRIVAMGLLGVAYRYGGTSANTGFDCSGFMQHIFRRSMQINLPRTSAEQARMGEPVSRSDLQPGDMVFFNTAGRRISHVGLYIGNNRFIHAPRTGKNIEITSLSNKYWNSKYVTARRVKKNDPARFLQ